MHLPPAWLKITSFCLGENDLRYLGMRAGVVAGGVLVISGER